MSSSTPHQTLRHEPGAHRPVAAETVAEWERGTFIEGLAARPDGSWLVSVPSHDRVDVVTPDGDTEVFARLPHHGIGIVTDGAGAGAYVVVGAMHERNWQLMRITAGRAEPVCPLPELTFGNGMAGAGGELFAVDSARGLVLRIDPLRATSSIWLRHPLLDGFTAEQPMPGANGIAVRDGWVYVSSTGRALVARCPVDSTDPAADLETIATHLVADDFDVAADGRAYLATHFHDSVLALDPDGDRTTIAGPQQHIVGSTSVAIDPRTPSDLLVSTTGGMKGVTKPGPEPARLVRLHLDRPDPAAHHTQENRDR